MRDVRCWGDDAKATAYRLALVDGVRTAIKNGLGMIGVSAPEEM